jgi:hypothetical protein
MGMYDVRTQGTEGVDEIVFADSDATTQGVYKVMAYASDELRIFADGVGSTYLRYDDIDNFILALQKAKELWSGD